MKQEIKQEIVGIDTIRRVSKIELVKFQLEWIFNNSQVSLNNTEILTLSYIFLYKDKAHYMMVKDNHVSREKSIENIISKFRKKGLILGKGSSVELHSGITPVLSDIDFTIKLRLDGN